MCRYLVYVGIYFMCQKMFEKQQKENSKECWACTQPCLTPLRILSYLGHFFSILVWMLNKLSLQKLLWDQWMKDTMAYFTLYIFFAAGEKIISTEQSPHCSSWYIRSVSCCSLTSLKHYYLKDKFLWSYFSQFILLSFLVHSDYFYIKQVLLDFPILAALNN